MSELYQLPDGWEWKTINDVCIKVTDGAHKSPKTIDIGKPYITVKDINDEGIIDFKNCKFISDEDFELLVKGNCKPNNGDVLFSKDGTVGKVALVNYDIDFVVLSSLAILKPSENILSEYLKNYLLSPYFFDKAIKSKTGAAIKRVVLKTIKELNIPLSPLSEQSRIVSKLDALFEKIDKAIALHVKNMEEADAFMGSVLNDVFGGLEEKYGLQSILEGIYIGCKRGFNPTVKDGKVPFIGMSDIDEHNGINTNYVMEDYKKVSSGKTKFEKNAVLVGKIFPCTQNNKTSIVPSDINGGFATTEVYALHSKDNMNPFYLNNYIRSKEINDYMVSTMVGATGRQRVPSETIKSIQIPIPPLPIQQKTVTYLDEISQKIEKIKQVQKEKLSSLKALKASILDQAFRGEL